MAILNRLLGRRAPARRLTVFGGLIGLAVDASTGGLHKLSPVQITADVQAGDLTVEESAETLVLSVVLRPEAGWERVGTLVRE